MEDRGSKMEDGASAEAWRLFVAISLPDAVREEIEKVQREMRRELSGNFMRWTKREQFHLTLKFLGNVPEGRVVELSDVLRGACAPFKALRLRAERIGFFPDMRYPRVAWAWVRDEKELLPRLQQAIEMSVQPFTDERAEKKFTGHVTLARIQGIKRPQAEILSKFALGLAESFFGEWVADKVELIRSELSSGGARYTTVAEFPLSGP
jgi:RNA 2',3'-cyclic 3'-phosphodiesterase